MPPGEARGSGGGLIGKIWEARREPEVEEVVCWVFDVAGVTAADVEALALREFWRDGFRGVAVLLFRRLRGDGGTELRSGAILAVEVVNARLR